MVISCFHRSRLRLSNSSFRISVSPVCKNQKKGDKTITKVSAPATTQNGRSAPSLEECGAHVLTTVPLLLVRQAPWTCPLLNVHEYCFPCLLGTIFNSISLFTEGGIVWPGSVLRHAGAGLWPQQRAVGGKHGRQIPPPRCSLTIQSPHVSISPRGSGGGPKSETCEED